MADNGRRAGVHKFCLEFAETGICNKLICTFWHKLPRHFRIINIKRNDHYILGRLIKIALCRYFQTGICPHGSNCRYLHSTNPNAGRGVSQNGTPSTSRNVLRTLNPSTNVNREHEETENACALPLTDAQKSRNDEKKKKNSLSVTAPEFVPISPDKASCSATRNKNENKVTANKVERKQCGICFETVLSKVEGEPRFGILPNCNHCYCLTCIRKWRQSRQFENQRCCPECRIKSDFVCPSSIWVENSEAKQKIIDKYKAALATKDCKYFGKGMGRCPFGNKCFYRHAFPDGSTCDVGPPRGQRRGSHNELNGSYNELISSTGEVFETVILWDLLDDDLEDDDPRFYGFTDNLVDFFSDSDSSWSGYDIFLD